MKIRGVLGTAAGQKGLLVLIERKAVARKVPKRLEDVPVIAKVTGEIRAMSDPTARFDRPVPIGVSTGNEGEFSAGTIACRVADRENVYALSNNHVYALENAAPIGSRVLQPGLFDTDGAFSEENVIGILHDFEPIEFGLASRNKIDAAIAVTTEELVKTGTPSDGYGIPRTKPTAASLGSAVQKFGRTTGLTHGEVSGVNAFLLVTYQSGVAVFVDQILVEDDDIFIQAGDSGSLLVTDPGRRPVGLLFAGNEDGTLGVANRIGLVMRRFKVAVDSREE
jgi:hypothetical protein